MLRGRSYPPRAHLSMIFQSFVAFVDAGLLHNLRMLWLIALQVYLIKDTLWRHSYPYKANSVPSWTVPVYSFGLPLLAFALHKVAFADANRKITWLDW